MQGIPEGTTCQMWVTYTNGTHAYVTSWMTCIDEGKVFYWGSLPATTKTVASFQVTTGNQTLVSVPA